MFFFCMKKLPDLYKNLSCDHLLSVCSLARQKQQSLHQNSKMKTILLASFATVLVLIDPIQVFEKITRRSFVLFSFKSNNIRGLKKIIFFTFRVIPFRLQDLWISILILQYVVLVLLTIAILDIMTFISIRPMKKGAQNACDAVRY